MSFSRAVIALMLCASMAFATSGCVSKSKSRNAARKAFQAGQAQAAMTAEAERDNIKVSGQVLVPIVEWREGLTLAEAIVAAHWTGNGDPGIVTVIRKGERVELTPSESVAAAQLPMEPGDQIELLP